MTDDRLRLLVERYERLCEEEDGIRQDKKDVLAEVHAVGYDRATFRAVIKRRAMPADDRAEADHLLELYEAALGMGGRNADSVPMRPAAAELAALLLAEQLDGMDDPAQAELLIGHVMFLLDIRAEIRLLRESETARKKLAKSEGFDAPQMSVTVRWFEKVAKHGLEMMRAGEETFKLYRATVERRDGPPPGEVTNDPVLAAMIAAPAPKPPTAKARQVNDALAYARISKMNRGD